MKKIANYIIMFFLAVTIVSCNNMQKIKDENGNIIETFALNENGNKEGVFTRFDNQGNTIEIANYVDGKLEGKREIFYQSGQVELVENYQNNIINGECITYYKNGKIKLIYIYDDGVMNNSIKKYSENGVLLEEVQMKNNEENGPFKEYHENGKIKWEGQYVKGENEYGILKEYDATGSLLKKMTCDTITVSGELNSICRTIWTKEQGDIKLKPLDLKL